MENKKSTLLILASVFSVILGIVALLIKIIVLVMPFVSQNSNTIELYTYFYQYNYIIVILSYIPILLGIVSIKSKTRILSIIGIILGGLAVFASQIYFIIMMFLFAYASAMVY